MQKDELLKTRHRTNTKDIFCAFRIFCQYNPYRLITSEHLLKFLFKHIYNWRSIDKNRAWVKAYLRISDNDLSFHRLYLQSQHNPLKFSTITSPWALKIYEQGKHRSIKDLLPRMKKTIYKLSQQKMPKLLGLSGAILCEEGIIGVIIFTKYDNTQPSTFLHGNILLILSFILIICGASCLYILFKNWKAHKQIVQLQKLIAYAEYEHKHTT